MQDIKRGSRIIVKHIKSGRTIEYMIVCHKANGSFRLINLDSGYLMYGFCSQNPMHVVDYIENNLKCTILHIKN